MPKHTTGVPIDGHSEYEWDIYKKSPPMSTYTVAMVVVDSSLYNFTETHSGNIGIRAWYRLNNSHDPNDYHVDPYHKMELNANYTSNLLKFFEGYFNVDYKLPKLDSILYTKHPYWAMENWGLISYNSWKFADRLIISHELSHNWFGNLITCKSFNE